MTERFDVAVIGAGAAGMMCAAVAGQRGRSVVLIDHAERLAEKIRISGGGRCNFTNRDVGPANFISGNPHFARSALDRYTSRDFVALIERHRIAYHEKHRGQLFCDDSSEQVIAMLVAECEAGRVHWRRPTRVLDLVREHAGFRIETSTGPIACARVVVATGGLSIPKIGASDFAYRIAKRFAIRVIEPRPALVPLTFATDTWAPLVELAGVALEVDIGCGDTSFREDLLFTHRGLSGPAVLQISSYWKHGAPLTIDLAPAVDLAAALVATKAVSKQQLASVLADHLPRRLVTQWQPIRALAERRVAELPDATLREAARSLTRWSVTPDGTEGFRKAEVTVGGVDTNELSQQTFEARRVSGLHFIGEAVDVTGWLGGYNFQWAWSSGAAAGRAV